MTDCLVFIQINQQPYAAFEKPLIKALEAKVPDLTTFDFDNFSEESIRHYALDLIKQSRKAAVVVEVQAAEGPHTGLVSFFNGLQQQKHPNLLMVQQGPLPEPLEKMMRVLGGPNYRTTSSTAATTEHLIHFLQMP